MYRMSNQMRLFLIAFLAAVLIVILLKTLEHDRGPVPGRPRAPIPGRATTPQSENRPPDASVHLLMGNPSGATADPRNADNYLMRKPYFALSYNNSCGTPNWVSWGLQKSDLGDAKRDQFYPDTDLPRSLKHVTPKEYSGTGFDRGHMCPHGDRSNSPEASRATFAMTNIVPQSPNCNYKAWADLEDYSRSLARRGHTLYIVAGPQGVGGEGSEGPKDTIARGEVTVPAYTWKVMMVLKGGTGTEEDIARVGPDTRLIAVVMPNDQSVDHGWAKYRTSVKKVETLTGYRFFDRVPADILGPLKEKVDQEHIPNGGHRKRGD
jgi:endonuclease G